MNRKEAAANARKKRLEKYGSKEALEEAQRKHGKWMGETNKGKQVGFAADPSKARSAGRLSGHIRRMNKRSQKRG